MDYTLREIPSFLSCLLSFLLNALKPAEEDFWKGVFSSGKCIGQIWAATDYSPDLYSILSFFNPSGFLPDLLEKSFFNYTFFVSPNAWDIIHYIQLWQLWTLPHTFLLHFKLNFPLGNQLEKIFIHNCNCVQSSLFRDCEAKECLNHKQHVFHGRCVFKINSTREVVDVTTCQLLTHQIK